MASNKAKLLEARLQDEVHPLTARIQSSSPPSGSSLGPQETPESSSNFPKGLPPKKEEATEKQKTDLHPKGVFTRLGELSDERESPQADMTASGQVRKSASPQAGKYASPQVDKSASLQADMTADRESYIRQWLEMKASKKLTFRCPPDIWRKIEEVKLQVHQRHQVKLSAAAMLTATMATLFWDVEHNDPTSIAYKLLLELKKEDTVEE